MMRAVQTAVTVALVPAVLSAGPVVPFEIQIPLVLKALTYDRTLKARAGDRVRIAVVVPARTGGTVAEEFQASINALERRTVNGLPVVFKEVMGSEEAALAQSLDGGRWAVAYVMPGFKTHELAMVSRICAARHILTVAADGDDVAKGMAFGVGVQGGKPQLLINLASTKAAGSEFDLALLRLARTVDSADPLTQLSR